MPMEIDASGRPAARPLASPMSASPAAPRPPGLLLRSGGHADLRFPGECQLALDSLRLVRLLRRDRRPGRWNGAAFERNVELVRAHLAPIRNPALLAASFGREAMHVAGRRPGDLTTSPVRVAYAVRWLELGDGEQRPRWRELAGPAPATAP